MPGSVPERFVRTVLSASVPPVEAPIRMTSMFVALRTGPTAGRDEGRVIIPAGRRMSVVCALGDGVSLGRIGRERDDDDDRHWLVFHNELEEAQAIHARHLDVEREHVRPELKDLVRGRLGSIAVPTTSISGSFAKLSVRS